MWAVKTRWEDMFTLKVPAWVVNDISHFSWTKVIIWETQGVWYKQTSGMEVQSYCIACLRKIWLWLMVLKTNVVAPWSRLPENREQLSWIVCLTLNKKQGSEVTGYQFDQFHTAVLLPKNRTWSKALLGISSFLYVVLCYSVTIFRILHLWIETPLPKLYLQKNVYYNSLE